MTVESVTHISDLNATYPASGDPKSEGDNHIRNIKSALKTDFPNITGPVTSSHTELNLLDGLTVQPAAKDGSNLTTPTLGDSSTKIATTAFVAGTAFAATLPGQLGNSGKFLKTDGTNASWDYAGLSNVGSTITTDMTLDTIPTYYPVAMTARGKSATAPDATMLAKGLMYVLDNRHGGYPIGFRDSTGVLRSNAVAAGGMGFVWLRDNSTAAGHWEVTGDGLEPGLITIDNTFSSTYSSTVLKPFVALDDNKSIHFLQNASSVLFAVVVDKSSAAVGTPVSLTGAFTGTIRAAFKVSSTSAIVFYTDGGTGQDAAVVITLSGATSLSVGAQALANNQTEWTAEDFSGAPKIAQLASTLYVVSYTYTTNTRVLAVSVSGTTVTVGFAANIITANSVANSTTTYALTATTALVLYKSGAAAPYANNAVVISVSGTTCTVGTPAAMTGCASAVQAATVSCLLSATKALVFDDNNASTAVAAAITISGNTVTAGTALTVESVAINAGYIGENATRYNPQLFPLSASTALLWYKNAGISRAVVLSESGGTVTKGAILYQTISAASATASGGGMVQPQGATEFIAMRQQGVSGSVSYTAQPHKISGTTVTNGAAKEIRGQDRGNLEIYNHGAIRLASGDYIFCASLNAVSSTASAEFHVMRTNGDFISDRGTISAPPLCGSRPYLGAVASNRAVIIGSFPSTAGASTYQLRLLSVEIAQ